jgi:CspA family cold shock protein
MVLAHEVFDDAEVLKLEGRVKWYDPARGYGFIDASDGQGDILLHASCLRRFGKGPALPNAEVVCKAIKGDKGRQAVEIVEMTGGDAEAEARPRRFHPHKAVSAPFCNAVVKWFDALRGYGFVTCESVEGDVFLHAATLRRAGLNEVQPGESLQVRCVEGPKGALAAEIRPAAH